MGNLAGGGGIDVNTGWKVFHLIKTNLICVLLKAWFDAAAANGPRITASYNEPDMILKRCRTYGLLGEDWSSPVSVPHFPPQILHGIP